MDQLHEFTIAEEFAGKRLDVTLAALMPDMSRNRCQDLIRAGAVTLGGATISEPKHRVKQGETLTLKAPPPTDPTPQPENIPLDILFEDDALIVIDKPAGLVVHPAPGSETGTLVNALIHHCGESLSGIGGVRRPGIVHRLDKDTSGVMVVAKTETAHNHLAAQFADHGRTGALERVYAAIVWGVPNPAAGTIDTQIGRAPHNRLKQAVLKDDNGRQAITHYRLADRFGQPPAETSLIECRLETGRTHQIRVHLAHIGHPLLGDTLYGAGFATKSNRLSEEAQAALAALGRQALHAKTLAFEHPLSGAVMRFETDLPAEMAALVETLAETG
jgi:23S rRNA pseudouridine1911/1915/1917 synthase